MTPEAAVNFDDSTWQVADDDEMRADFLGHLGDLLAGIADLCVVDGVGDAGSRCSNDEKSGRGGLGKGGAKIGGTLSHGRMFPQAVGFHVCEELKLRTRGCPEPMASGCPGPPGVSRFRTRPRAQSAPWR